MKKGGIVLLLLGILLVSPLILAQEQSQTYSGFNRLTDNIKMFFASGDNKVMLALEIREKELNSAIVNTQNGEDEKAEKNLERARKRLKYVQEKVSPEIADEVKIDVDKTINKINKEEDLSDGFETYILEEEKTGLTAELVIEVDGKEGHTLTREVVIDVKTGQNKVDINVEGDDAGMVIEGEVEGQVQEQTRTREIETRIIEIDEVIAEIVIQRSVIEDSIKTKDEGVTLKTPAGNDLGRVDPGPDGITGPDHENSNGGVDKD